MDADISIEGTATQAMLSQVRCGLFAVAYVGSLYLWRDIVNLPRDDPRVVKRRTISVLVVCALATLHNVLYFGNDVDTMWRTSGVRVDGLVLGALLPLLLAVTLFLGPLAVHYFDYRLLGHSPFFNELKAETSSILFWRNYVVGPFAEEWVFRACMLPIIMDAGLGWKYAVVVSPWFFGIAHVHHVIESIRHRGYSLSAALPQAILQLLYTTVFGSFCAFIFLRTGHILGPILCHSFCNVMGFPHFEDMESHRKKHAVTAAYVVGLVGFIVLLYPLTAESIHHSMYSQMD